MSSARGFIEEAIKILDRLIANESLGKELRASLVHVRSLLFKADIEVIALYKICTEILKASLDLARYLDVKIVKTKIENTLPSEGNIREKLLSAWEIGKTLSLEEVETIVGPRSKELIDQLLKEGIVKIAKIEWDQGDLHIYYKRIK